MYHFVDERMLIFEQYTHFVDERILTNPFASAAYWSQTWVNAFAKQVQDHYTTSTAYLDGAICLYIQYRMHIIKTRNENLNLLSSWN